MAYKYFTESFDYDTEPKKRKRPIRVTGDVPTTPHKSPVREDIMPLSLHEEGKYNPDILPHNTVRGHLIGLDSLGGEEDPDNLVPMYGAFNLSTYKTSFENVLKGFAQVSGVDSATVDLRIKYSSAFDERIPVSFSYTLKVSFLDGASTSHKDSIPHPAPQAAFVPYEKKLAEYIAEMDKEMRTNKWWVEDHVTNRAGAAKHSEHGQPLVLTDKDYTQRPYAVLDYILHGKKDYKVFGIACAPEIYNGGDWSQNQIEAILATNLAKNAGYYKSDDANDYVYKGKSALYKNPDHAKYYYLHAHSAGGSTDGVLLMSGYHQKPEVDHIIMKRKHINPGCNAYSNARVISRYLNSEDRGKYSQ